MFTPPNVVIRWTVNSAFPWDTMAPRQFACNDNDMTLSGVTYCNIPLILIQNCIAVAKMVALGQLSNYGEYEWHTGNTESYTPSIWQSFIAYPQQFPITHWDRDKLAVILQITFSNPNFFYVKVAVSWHKFHWSLEPNSYQSRIGLDDDSTPHRRQTVIWNKFNAHCVAVILHFLIDSCDIFTQMLQGCYHGMWKSYDYTSDSDATL